MKLTVSRKARYKPTRLDELYGELDALLDDFCLPKSFYVSKEWTYYVINRMRLLDEINKEEGISKS